MNNFDKVKEGESPRDKQKRLHSEMIIAQMEQASNELKATLKEKYESNAEVQRLKAQTIDERMRRAISLMVKAKKEYNDCMSGTDTTQDKAEREVARLVEKYLNTRDIN